MIRYIFLFLFSVFISSWSQILLKSSAGENHDSFIREYLNIKVVIAYMFFFVSSLLTVFAYKYVPLSLGPVLEASGYIFVAILGGLLLKEKLEKRKIMGLIIIFVGILVSNL